MNQLRINEGRGPTQTNRQATQVTGSVCANIDFDPDKIVITDK